MFYWSKSAVSPDPKIYERTEPLLDMGPTIQSSLSIIFPTDHADLCRPDSFCEICGKKIIAPRVFVNLAVSILSSSAINYCGEMTRLTGIFIRAIPNLYSTSPGLNIAPQFIMQA
jgi:hypothetical protein